jgi:hypothetical protein
MIGEKKKQEKDKNVQWKIRSYRTKDYRQWI